MSRMGAVSRSGFQTTSWSLVLAAAGQPSTQARGALAKLCQTYWRPVYSFVRRTGYQPDQAQDLAQGFFLLLLEKKYLGDADRQRGRFRSFLLTSVKHFLANERDRAHALKRGGCQMPVSIDVLDRETLVEAGRLIWQRAGRPVFGLGSQGIVQNNLVVGNSYTGANEASSGGIILVGGDFLKMNHPYRSFINAAEAAKWLKTQSFQNTAFLIKGSRSMQMEKTLEALD